MRACCDEDGVCCSKTKRCRYHCPCPPLLIDTIYHRFRAPCLSIICILVIIAFGSSNIYGLHPLTCDQMYIIDPICHYRHYETNSYQMAGYNFTETHLIAQNKVFYEKEDNKYHSARLIDTYSTFILLIGNSPYHSPVWLVVGFIGSMYSTYIYTESIEYCSGDYCKTNENDRFYIPEECNHIIHSQIIDNETVRLCLMSDNNYSLCKKCVCDIAASDYCTQHINRGPVDRLHVLMSYFWFILIYLREIVTIVVMIKIIYKKCFGKKHQDKKHSFQLELIQNMNINNNQSNIVEQDDENKQENLTMDGTAGLIEMEMKTMNDNQLIIDSLQSERKNINQSISIFLSRWNENAWYTKLYKIFTNPLSVRLTAASCISIIMLIIICQIVHDISSFIVTFFFVFLIDEDHQILYINLIMILLWMDGIICIVIYLRSVWMMHHQFCSDVIAVYAYYNGIDQNHNDPDNIDIGDDGNIGNKILMKLKSLLIKLFPIHVPNGESIIDHVKKCRIMNAYLFIFMYPFSIMTGWIILFITMALPVILIACIIVISLLSDFENVWGFITPLIDKVWKMIVPLLGIIIFDRCILRRNTDQMLTQRKVNCFWYVVLVDTVSMMTTALFVTLWNIFVVRMVYYVGFFCYGLINPYKSAFPAPFEKYDKVYQTYCANVALATLSLLKSNEKISDTKNIMESN